MSKFHERNPYVLSVDGQEHRVSYLPGESDTGMFGGNSNWRGPVWLPVNALIIRALQNFYLYYGDNFKIECPTGSGKLMNLYEVSKEISNRLIGTFTRNEQGRRPVWGWTGLVAALIELYGSQDAGRALESGKQAAFARGARDGAKRPATPSPPLQTR